MYVWWKAVASNWIVLSAGSSWYSHSGASTSSVVAIEMNRIESCHVNEIVILQQIHLLIWSANNRHHLYALRCLNEFNEFITNGFNTIMLQTDDLALYTSSTQISAPIHVRIAFAFCAPTSKHLVFATLIAMHRQCWRWDTSNKPYVGGWKLHRSLDQASWWYLTRMYFISGTFHDNASLKSELIYGCF